MLPHEQTLYNKRMNQELHLEINQDTRPGKYANLTIITHTNNEFLLDFALTLPNQPGQITSRIITSPQHAKALLRALQENINRYENTYGTIEERAPRQQHGSSTQTN